MSCSVVFCRKWPLSRNYWLVRNWRRTPWIQGMPAGQLWLCCAGSSLLQLWRSPQRDEGIPPGIFWRSCKLHVTAHPGWLVQGHSLEGALVSQVLSDSRRGPAAMLKRASPFKSAVVNLFYIFNSHYNGSLANYSISSFWTDQVKQVTNRSHTGNFC